MDSLSFKTTQLNKATAQHDWVLVDAANQTLGRLASRIAFMLRGKHKPGFTPHVDCGDRVIVINADKIRLTGGKMTARPHMWYTGYPGGERFRTPREYIERGQSAKVIENAVWGMLPKGRLGRRIYTNLHVYAGTEHPHTAQNPKLVDLHL